MDESSNEFIEIQLEKVGVKNIINPLVDDSGKFYRPTYLYDKNKTLIYEGSIVKGTVPVFDEYNEEIEMEYTAVVVYSVGFRELIIKPEIHRGYGNYLFNCPQELEVVGHVMEGLEIV